MSALTAKGAEMTATPSVYASLGNNGSDGYGLSKIETYFHFTVEWRGQTINAEATADRYRHSSGWSDHRLIVHRTDPHVTDTARAAIREAVTPLALEWLAGDEYPAARLQSNARAIGREMRGERYGTVGVRRLIETVPLLQDDREALTRAADMTDERTALLDSIGA